MKTGSGIDSVRLRLGKDYVFTSSGYGRSIERAKTVLRYLMEIRKSATDDVQVITVENQPEDAREALWKRYSVLYDKTHVRIGCQQITWNEVVRMAKRLGIETE
jgi:hypothetical protein